MGATAAPAVATAWTTADWAFVVSLFSAAISLFSLGWGVWSKWIYPKARLRVGIAVMHLIDQDGKSPPFIGIFATNFGPTDTTIKNVIARSRSDGWWYKRGQHRWRMGIMMTVKTPDEAINPKGPSYNGLPTKLPVGEDFSTYATFKHQHMRDDNHVDVGFSDIFGRYHWAPRKSVQKVIASIKKDWPADPAA